MADTTMEDTVFGEPSRFDPWMKAGVYYCIIGFALSALLYFAG